jgi:trk system potassium uptake protein TrkA
MDIVIAGAGTIGIGAADKLSKENHSIAVIDHDRSKIDLVSNSIDCRTIIGSASSPETLRKAGIEKADMFLAVTNDDHVNIVSGIIAQSYNVNTRIGKINNAEFHREDPILKLRQGKVFHYLISPNQEAAQEIIRYLTRFDTPIDFNYFAREKAAIVTQSLSVDHPFIGKKLSELRSSGLGQELLIVAIDREGLETDEPTVETIIPTQDALLQEKDVIYVAGSLKAIEGFITSREEAGAKQVLIVGANELSLTVAREIERTKGWYVKIIDPDVTRCEKLSVQLDKTLVLHGEGTDAGLLKQEKIEHSQAIIALMRDDEEKNILIGLLGKSLKASKALCLTEKQDYSHLVTELGIDAAISPKQSALSAITRYTRTRVHNVISFKANNAEAIEFRTSEGTKITTASIQDVGLPENVLIGGVIRAGVFSTPVGTTRITTGDYVTVFTLPEQIPEVEKFFSKE